MNVETITMPPDVAAMKLKAYRKALHRRADAEYEQIARGYEALEKGLSLMNPFDAIRTAGWDENGLPKLAIARADRKRCRCDVQDWINTVCFDTSAGTAHAWSNDRLRIAVGNMPPRQQRTRDRMAIVPMIPADVYPAPGHGSPKDWFILWEADWKAAPEDPILLKPLGGELYAVLAAWDLTELERSIIAGTRAR